MRVTEPQMAHLAAAAAGALFVNGQPTAPVTRAVWVGGRARQAVVDRLVADGLLVPTPVPGASACRALRPSEAGRAVLTGVR